MRSTHLVLALLLIVMAQTAASAITVIVNGMPLPSYPPAVQVSGRVLLPMRMVFEALGAEVGWESATQTAIGIRGDITVRMSINSPTAYINDRPVVLDVPPQLIGGSTYMPVRFPAEAFGAEVGWHGPSQTVSIALAPLSEIQQPPEPPSTPEEPPPSELGIVVQPSQPQPGAVIGVVAAVQPTHLGLLVDSELQTYTVTDTTIILRQNQQVDATALRPGDQAGVAYDEEGNAILIRASYERLEGIVQAKVPNQILIDTRPDEILRVQPQVEVTTADGQPARYADINNGDSVVLRLTPGTSNVYAIVIQQPPAAPGEPPITPPPAETAEPVEEEPEFQAAASFVVLVTGVVSAVQSTRLGLVVDSELQIYTIADTTTILRQNQEVHATALRPGDLAKLLHDGQGNATLILASYESLEGIVQAKVPNQMLVDTRQEILQVQPEVEVTTADGQPARYADIKNGDSVVLRLTPGTSNVYGIVIQQPPTEPEEPTQPEEVTPPVIDQFYHDAEGPLKAGDILHVIMEGTPGGTAAFDIGEVQQEIRMSTHPRIVGRYARRLKIPDGLNALGTPHLRRSRSSGRTRVRQPRITSPISRYSSQTKTAPASTSRTPLLLLPSVGRKSPRKSRARVSSWPCFLNHCPTATHRCSWMLTIMREIQPRRSGTSA